MSVASWEEANRVAAATEAGRPYERPLKRPRQEPLAQDLDTAPPADDYQPPIEIPDRGEPITDDVVHTTTVEIKPIDTITPDHWDDEPAPKRWLAHNRIPAGDVTILAADGGTGKTEIAEQLHVAVAHGLGDWLGCTVDTGVSLFISAEEEEDDIRVRRSRIMRSRGLSPATVDDEHYLFPDLENAWFVTTNRAGQLVRTDLFNRVESWIRNRLPKLVIVDAIVAIFGAETNFNRQQVRAFVAMLRKIARETGAAIVLLDHPSVRGMSDGSGTSGSVDWNNSVRSRLLMTLIKDDPDARILEVMKLNGARKGEKVTLRWNGYTFAPEGSPTSPHRAAADRMVDDLFLRLLDKRNAQGRPVRPSTGRGSAPGEFADDPEANGTTAKAFRASMERLYSAGEIVTIESGPKSKLVKHIERARVG